MSNAPGSTDLSETVHLARGASYLVMQSLGINAVQVLAFVVLARLISTKEMGILAILLLINATCQTFTVLSIDQAVIKYVAENISRGNRLAAASSFYQAIRATLLISAPVVVALFLGAPFLASHLIGDVSYSTLFQVLAFDVLFYSGVLPVATGALLGLRRFREAAIPGTVVNGIIRQVLILSLIIVMKGLVGLVIAWLICDGATAIVLLYLATRTLGSPKFSFPFTQLLRFSLPLSLSNIANYAQTWFDRAMLVVFVPLATLGIYNATITGFTVLVGISLSVSNMLFPAYSSIKDKTDGRSIANASRLATRYVSFTLIPFALGLAATAKPSLIVFIGQAYAGGTVPLMILSTVFAVTTIFTTSLSPIFLALEETRAYAAITSLSVMISILVAYVLLPYLGIVGAATARAISMLIAAILIAVVLQHRTTLRLDREAIGKNLLAGIVMVTAVAATQLVFSRIIFLPLYILFGGLVYLLMLRVLRAVNPADMDLIRGFLGERLGWLSSFLRWILLTGD